MSEGNEYEIFLSYAREDSQQAAALANALRGQHGWDVFWDREIPAGEHWDQHLHARLQSADVVLVLWSDASIASTWVREEAREGLRRNVLVPVKLNNIEAPFGFGGVQMLDLSVWNGSGTSPEFVRLVRDIANKLNSTTNANQSLPDAGAVNEVEAWVAAATQARELGVIHSDRPLPTEVVAARARFEQWWADSGMRQKRQLDPGTVYQALSLVARLYRLQELQSETKPSASHWADATIRFFEETQNREFLVESLIDKSALLLELSQIKHTDPDSFSQIASQGDAVMARAASLANESQRAEVLRIWSRMYYNLSRPRSGKLSEDWNNNYLLLSCEKMKLAYELAPTDMKNSTQLARVTQKAAANPPQDEDPSWTRELRRVRDLLWERWQERSSELNSPNARLPPLNILGVISMDVGLREWREAREESCDTSSASFLEELDKFALHSLREALALVHNTEWEKNYDFDFHYDIARVLCVKTQILDADGSARADGGFREAIKNMSAARNGGTAIQIDAAYDAVLVDPTMAGLSQQRKEELRRVLLPEAAR